MKFKKEDLKFLKEYSWKADGGDNPNYIASLDRLKVDKTEGYEVLYFCNDFLVENNKPLAIGNFHWVEDLLRRPQFRHITSRKMLNEEILKNWSNYFNMRW